MINMQGRFEVGERVRAYTKECQGTVIQIDGNYYYVMFDDGDEIEFLSFELERVGE